MTSILPFGIYCSAGLKVNGESITLPSGSNAWTAIDTGTTGVGMPSSILQEVFAVIPDSEAGSGSTDGYYLYRE